MAKNVFVPDSPLLRQLWDGVLHGPDSSDCCSRGARAALASRAQWESMVLEGHRSVLVPSMSYCNSPVLLLSFCPTAAPVPPVPLLPLSYCCPCPTAIPLSHHCPQFFCSQLIRLNTHSYCVPLCCVCGCWCQRVSRPSYLPPAPGTLPPTCLCGCPWEGPISLYCAWGSPVL